ncbi:MAG: hypothetical protein IH602_01330 [Bryobacteraceae bacterium]|nr:hypothetical protein [Bryobacteraceae bacterium]
MKPRRWIALVAAMVLLAACGASLYVGWLCWPRPIRTSTPRTDPFWWERGGRLTLSPRRGVVLAEIARFQDEIFAYLMFNHMRGRPAFEGRLLLLSIETPAGDPHYAISTVISEDLLGGLDWLSRLEQEREIAGWQWRSADRQAVDSRWKETSVFIAAYNLPVERRMEHLSGAEKAAYTRRFLRFKSLTDPRVSRGEVLPVLSREAATNLAADIIEVSAFFDLPLEFFLGIGAMENNFMNVKGDIGNTVWKRRVEKGDVVLKRMRGRVLVLNESSGVWQITRETLRLAHRLYLKDRREYGLLPEHLRPPRKLNLDEVDPAHLTTYAGILLRDLLDRFDGNITLAVGAYNGGPGKPNLSYAEGVERAAAHARRVMEQAAAVHGRLMADQPVSR